MIRTLVLLFGKLELAKTASVLDFCTALTVWNVGENRLSLGFLYSIDWNDQNFGASIWEAGILVKTASTIIHATDLQKLCESQWCLQCNVRCLVLWCTVLRVCMENLLRTCELVLTSHVHEISIVFHFKNLLPMVFCCLRVNNLRFCRL